VNSAGLKIRLPLIAPPRCGLRGELNQDVWHPDLSQEERRLLDLLSAIQSGPITAG
jgi:hypothetical protein